MESIPKRNFTQNISLPPNHRRPRLLPPVAWNPYTSLRRREDVARTRPGWPWGPLEPRLGRRIIQVTAAVILCSVQYTIYTVQGYYSAVTYVDWLVGRLVAAVDSVAGETVVVLTSDHGWSLGQHAEWTKMSNYEARPGI